MSKTQKKNVEIVVINSDQVVQHIVPCQHEKDQKKTQASSSDITYSSDHRSKKKNTFESDDEENEDYRVTPAGSKDDFLSDLVEVYKFRTPKKSGQMAVKAKNSCTPNQKKDILTVSAENTPDKKQVLSQNTPDRKRASIQNTPERKSCQELKTPPRSQKTSKPTAATAIAHKRMESSTPYRLRKRNVNLQQFDSSSDDSISDTSSDGDDDSEEKDETCDKADMSSKPQMAATAELYFDLHSAAPVTSDRTLSSLQGPRLDLDTIHKVLKAFDAGHQKQLKALMEKHVRLFKRWMFHMCCGYNILLYGLGSKRLLLDKFRDEHLKDFSHLVVNGYFPSLTAKHHQQYLHLPADILNSITEEILDSPKGFTNVYSQIEFIKDAFKQRSEDFYLLIHNIDGVLLRSERSQAILSSLADIVGVHIIGSVDHINAALMWDQNKYCHFRWLWYEVATFQNYEAENSYENSLMVQQTGTLALSSLVHVMRSLTPNARQVFILLAEYQLEIGASPNYVGMSFLSLYHKCREAFLVNSDLTLQAQLVEFKDHRLIKSKKNFEGIEHLIIPIDNTTLKDFLQEHKSTSN